MSLLIQSDYTSAALHSSSFANVSEYVRSGQWLKDEQLTQTLIVDGRLSFECFQDDVWFIHFFLYENKSRKKDLNAGSIRTYERDLLHLLEYLYSLNPPVKLAQLTYVEISGYERWVHELIEQGTLAPQTVRKRLTLIKSLLRYGHRVQFFKHDYSADIRLPPAGHVMQERKLTMNEMQLLLTEMKDSPLNRLIGAFLLVTGLRISELCGAKWGDVYQGTTGQVLMKVNGKGGKLRVVKVRSDIFVQLIQYRAQMGYTIMIGTNKDEPLIMNGSRRPLVDRVVRYMIERAARRAGIAKPVSPHWFRHSMASFSLAKGADIVKVKEQLGHADIRTTQQYLHDLSIELDKTAGDFIELDV